MTLAKHNCSISTVKQVKGGHGHAIIECWEDDQGQFWVTNDEYANTVNYCPYCGAKAPVQMEISDEIKQLNNDTKEPNTRNPG